VLNLLASGQYVLGRAVEEFEASAARVLEAKHAVGVANGTDAIEIALRAMGVGRGDEVITTPFSFIAAAEVIADLEAVPVFVDIELDTFNLNPALIEAAITPRTRAIIPVHLFGHAADMTAINAVAARHGLPVIEDAAQAWGAAIEGRPVGGLGTMATFSFFPTKNLGACGEGGLIATNDDKLAASARVLRVHGQSRRYIHDEIGYNSRLHALQAAILSVKLPHAEGWNQARRNHAARYAELLAGTPYIVPTERSGFRHVYHQYTLRVPAEVGRDRVSAALSAAGIGNMIYYPVPLHRQPVFAERAHCAGPLPETERAVSEVISLPIFPELRSDEIESVASALIAAL